MSASILAKTFVRVGSLRGVDVEVHLTLLPATAIFGVGSPAAQLIGASAVIALLLGTFAEVRASRPGLTLRLTPLGLGQVGAGVLERGAAALAGARTYFWLCVASLVAWAGLRWTGHLDLAGSAILAAGTAGALLFLALLPTELLGGRSLWRAAVAQRLRTLPRPGIPAPLRASRLEPGASSATTWAVQEAERIARNELARLRAEHAERDKER